VVGARCAGRDWSADQKWLRTTVWGVFIPVELVMFLAGDRALNMLGVEKHWAAFLSACISWNVALFLSRYLCGLFWPERVRKAEENATRWFQKIDASRNVKSG
jgi:hypothetical protein